VPTVTRFPRIYDAASGQACSLADIIDEIRSDTHQRAIHHARAAYRQHGKQAEAYTSAKNQLPYFTPGGTFSRRSSSGLIRASGLVQGDIDQLAEQMDYAWTSLFHDPHTVYLFTSPSGDGLKFAFSIPLVADNACYRRYFDALCLYIKEQYDFGIDEACKSISHACYLSHDATAYYNPNAELFAPQLQAAKPAPAKPFIPPRPTSIDTQQQKKMEWALNRIAQAAKGERHITRLNTAQLVGGWIAGGIVDASAAHDLRETAAANSDQPVQARRDVDAGLRYGAARPLYAENRGIAQMYRTEVRGARIYHG